MIHQSRRTTVGRRTVLATGAAGAGLAGLAVTSHAPPSSAGAADAAGGRGVFRHGVASGDPRAARRADLDPGHARPRASTPGSGHGTAGHGPLGGRDRQAVPPRRPPRRVRHRPEPRPHGQGRRDRAEARDLVPLPVPLPRRHQPDRPHPHRPGRATRCPANLRFGVVSCANLQAGWFRAYRDLAERDDLHAVLHLGDYLYEYGPGEYGYGQDNRDIRRHEPAHEMVSLADYRQRHAQYKRDPDLQDAAREVPLDRHLGRPRGHQRPVARRRGEPRRERGRLPDAPAPARTGRTTSGCRCGWTAPPGSATATRLFRRLRFGRLAELSMLDLRTYRSEQVASPAPPAPWPDGEVSDPDRTITGDRQLEWLKDSLRRAPRPQWKLVGNPVMIAPVNFGALPDELVDPINDVTGLLPEDGAPYNVDQWDGYTADRRAGLRATSATTASRTRVFITGDIHSGWACDLPYDAGDVPGRTDRGVGRRGVRLHLGDLQQPQGHHRHAAAHDEHRGRGRRSTPTTGTSSTSTSTTTASRCSTSPPKRAQMDWFVIGDRADQRRDDHLDHVVRHPGRQQPGRRRRPAGGCLMCEPPTRSRRRPTRRPRAVAPSSTAGAAGLVFSPRWLVLGARPPPPRPRDGSAPTCWSSTAAAPTRSTPTLTPNLHGAARRRAATTRGPVAAGDGDHPQPRDDDDRRAARTGTACRPTRSTTARSARSATMDRPARHPDRAPSSTGSTAPAARTGTVLSKEYLYGVFGDRATHRWEPAPIIPVSGHAPDAVHDGRRARDGRGVRPAPGVRQPRRHRPVRPRRPHRHRRSQAAATARAGRHRPPGAAVRRPAEVDRPLGALDGDRARRPLDGLVAAAPT